jgi:mono/diheme cytochrome c family protein
MHRYLLTAVLALGVAFGAAFSTTRAQTRASVLDGVYSHAQASRGGSAYATRCSGCHEGQDADGPVLVGKAFLDRWREDSLAPLFTFIKTTMPGNAPGTLDDGVVADVVAYLLEANGLPPGTSELAPDAVGAIQLVGLDGPQPLANLTIVRAVGCLSPQPDNAWALTRARSPRPVRERVVKGTSPEELALSASQPLGTETFPLMSVPQPGASYAGHKVQVKGVLNRRGSLERINVMSLDSVAATCDAPAAEPQTAAPRADGVRAANSRFAGVWKLVGEETRDPSGRIVPGPNAASGGRFGFITYDPAGYMGVVLAWNKRPAFKGKASTPEQARSALAAYNSYWGSFTVNDARGVVTHQTMGAVSPSFAGTNQERGFTFAGNRLTLRPPNLANGDQRSLTWERVPDLPALTPMHRKLIGFWKLISIERRDAKGQLSISNPGMTGFIVYTASGHVMVHMMDPYRRRNVGASPTADETMATYRTYTSYFGPFTVNEAGGYVTHHLTAAFNSGDEGTDFQRFAEFSGKRLTLKPPATAGRDGQRVETSLIWERLSD